MSYSQNLMGRVMTDRVARKPDKKKEDKPKHKTHFPFIFAVLLAVAFYFLTQQLLPSIVIPFGIWLIIKVRG